MRVLRLLVLVFSTPAIAQVGFYQSLEPPGKSRQWSELCIERTAGPALNVTLFGAYCPTVRNDCENIRFDELTFQAELRKGLLVYKSAECQLHVHVLKGGARITQQGQCGQYNLFAGQYAKRAAEVWADDCSPRGNAETHHQ